MKYIGVVALFLVSTMAVKAEQIAICVSSVPQGWNLSCEYDFTSKSRDGVTAKAMYEKGWRLINIVRDTRDSYSTQFVFAFEKNEK